MVVLRWTSVPSAHPNPKQFEWDANEMNNTLSKKRIGVENLQVLKVPAMQVPLASCIL